MTRNRNILFIFEGKKTEPYIMQIIKKLYFKNYKCVFISYCSNIQSLFNELNKDDDLDLVGLLKEKEKKKKKHSKLEKKLEKCNRDEFSEIYLFFDYDINLKTQNEKIKEMLELFDNETEKGKLYINYPMVESIRYFKKELPDEYYYTYTTNLFIGKEFKREAHNSSHYKNLDFITSKNKNQQSNWKHIIDLNIKKANHICSDLNELPSKKISINQQEIFKNQLSKYVSKNEIAILNSFPLFLYEYFPINYFN